MTRLLPPVQQAKVAVLGLLVANLARYVFGPVANHQELPWWIPLVMAPLLWVVAWRMESGRDESPQTFRLSNLGRQRSAMLMKVFAASFVGIVVSDRVLSLPWLHETFWLVGFGSMLWGGIVVTAEKGDEAVKKHARGSFWLYAVFLTA